MFRLLDSTYEPHQRMGRHEDDFSRISIVARGVVWESIGRREETGSAASVVVKPAGVPHENVIGAQGARILSIIPGHSRVFDRWQWIHRGPVSSAAVRLLAAVARATPSGVGMVEECARQLMEALEKSPHPDDGPSPPAWLRRVFDRLNDDEPDDLSVFAMARAAEVHPVHLTRSFRRYYHSSITGYRRQLRVRAAAHRLASSDEPMSTIALDIGFSDQSHMCRVFKQLLGFSPGGFRAMTRSV